MIRDTTIGEVEEPFSPSDRRLLDDLARQDGAAVYGVRLTPALQRSGGRLVTVHEEERLLRRDLHDGLEPRDVGTTFEQAGHFLGRQFWDPDPGQGVSQNPLPSAQTCLRRI